MQIICLFLLPVLDPLSMKVAEIVLLFLHHEANYSPMAVTVNFVFSMTILLLALIAVGLEKRKFSN